MILTILKIIGIILLVILLLVVALLLLVLFMPVVYRGSGEAHEGHIKGEVTVNWLFHALFFSLVYDDTREEKVVKNISVFGIPLEKIKALLSGKKDPEKEKAARKKKLEKLKENDPETYERLREEARERRRLERERLKAEEEAEKEKEARQKEALKRKKAKVKKRAAYSVETTYSAIRRFVRRTVIYAVEFIQDLFWLPWDITNRMRTIFRKVRDILGTVSRWSQFIFDPSTMRLLRTLIKVLKKLLGHIRPREFKGNVTFGFEDPYQTGLVLAGAESCYPLWCRSVVIAPDFTQKTLEGDLMLRGRIFLSYVVWQALKVLFDKDVKRAIKFLKQEKERTNG